MTYTPHNMANPAGAQTTVYAKEQADELAALGWTMVDQVNVDRPRRRRPKGWLAKAIADGSVADPAVGGQPPQIYSDQVHVIAVPEATARGTIVDTE